MKSSGFGDAAKLADAKALAAGFGRQAKQNINQKRPVMVSGPMPVPQKSKPKPVLQTSEPVITKSLATHHISGRMNSAAELLPSPCCDLNTQYSKKYPPELPNLQYLKAKLSEVTKGNRDFLERRVYQQEELTISQSVDPAATSTCSASNSKVNQIRERTSIESALVSASSRADHVAPFSKSASSEHILLSHLPEGQNKVLGKEPITGKESVGDGFSGWMKWIDDPAELLKKPDAEMIRPDVRKCQIAGEHVEQQQLSHMLMDFDASAPPQPALKPAAALLASQELAELMSWNECANFEI